MQLHLFEEYQEPLKRCTKCQKVKSLSEYGTYQRAKRSKKPQPVCKQCQIVYRQEYDQRPNVIKRKREYMRNYHKTYEYPETSKIHRREYMRVYMLKYGKKYPEKKKAQKTVMYAILRGDLPIISARICADPDCNNQANHYHHVLGYSKEKLLDVIPLCRSCHIMITMNHERF